MTENGGENKAGGSWDVFRVSFELILIILYSWIASERRWADFDIIAINVS